MMKKFTFIAVVLIASASLLQAASPSNHFSKGVELYSAGRFSEAVESFEQAIKKKDNAKSAQNYIDRIRKETVERIRNKALTGVNKSSWQNKFYFMSQIDKRVRVGISAQEVFERESTNFRAGALDAMADLARIMARAEHAHFDVEMINEMNTESQTPNTTLAAQQMTALFSYLSLAARNQAPRF